MEGFKLDRTKFGTKTSRFQWTQLRWSYIESWWRYRRSPSRSKQRCNPSWSKYGCWPQNLARQVNAQHPAMWSNTTTIHNNTHQLDYYYLWNKYCFLCIIIKMSICTLNITGHFSFHSLRTQRQMIRCMSWIHLRHPPIPFQETYRENAFDARFWILSTVLQSKWLRNSKIKDDSDAKYIQWIYIYSNYAKDGGVVRIHR